MSARTGIQRQYAKKFLTLNEIILLGCVIGGLYGIVHDQLTYTISPEYYTKFKFYQFGLAESGNEALFPTPRLQVSLVGFMATWWMGLFIGIILGIIGLIHTENRQMLFVTLKAMLVTMAVALATGFIGLAYGKWVLAKTGVNWRFPQNLVDKESFIAVGSMHNFSYLGGAAGLIAAVIYSIRQRKKTAPARTRNKKKARSK
ncbi:hypothetical protein [Niastella vici]|uniref:hypothetical protein n=1 Tax=Niastella vici TaxID=1703345 RepID=UPI001FE7FB8D|nr:hypothetical protein [Niastella vici]